MAFGTSDIGMFGYVHVRKSDEYSAIMSQIFRDTLYVILIK